MFLSSVVRSVVLRPRRLLVLFSLFFFFLFALQTIQSRFHDELRRTSSSEDGDDEDKNSSSAAANSTAENEDSGAMIRGKVNVTKIITPCERDYLRWYNAYCQVRVKPRYDPLNETNSTLLCPCLPNDLVGFVPLNETVPTLDQLENESPAIDGGHEETGRWRPSWCVARQRVAIIIPYGERERHLRIFLQHMHPILQRQLIDYSIFVIEQLSPNLFNRAALMNVGFVEARNWATTTTTTNDDDDGDDEERERPFDCFIFHDIDQLPIDDRNFYVCTEAPRHVVGHRKKFNYSFAYSTSFGGGNSFTAEEFQLINGFSNTFYGWGGEDDDLYQRTVAKNLDLMRYPRCIAKYDEVTHERDKRNPMGVNQPLGFKLRPEVYDLDGLTSLNYTVESVQTFRLFTKISVHLPPPPPQHNKHHYG